MDYVCNLRSLGKVLFSFIHFRGSWPSNFTEKKIFGSSGKRKTKTFKIF
jgi:hypothetical protein